MILVVSGLFVMFSIIFFNVMLYLSFFSVLGMIIMILSSLFSFPNASMFLSSNIVVSCLFDWVPGFGVDLSYLLFFFIHIWKLLQRVFLLF